MPKKRPPDFVPHHSTAEHVPTEATRKLVQERCGRGVPQEMVAVTLGIDPKTLRKHYENDIAAGAAEATAYVTGVLMKKIMEGNLAATIFWLKARAGWRETEVKELVGANGASILLEFSKTDAQL